MLKYKGYTGHVEFDEEAEILHGEVINIHNDVITFQADSIPKIKKAFIDSIEDYFAFCKERREQPERPSLNNSNLTSNAAAYLRRVDNIDVFIKEAQREKKRRHEKHGN